MPQSKPLRYTTHARDALVERDLDPMWVEATVREPEWSSPDPQHLNVERRFRTIPEFNGRVLRVACLETADEIRIITVFFDRDARRPS